MKKMLLVLSLIFALLLSSNIALAAGAQDFTLVNHTGRDILYVYVSPSTIDEWQEDVMGTDILTDGSSVNIHFDRGESATYWDLKVVFEDDSSRYWTKFNLKKISKITLKSNGKAVYE